MTLAAGSKLGPYEILGQIGAGGMGEVYKARDKRLERMVAVKVLPSQLSASPEVRQRFEREARTISQLSHPHICALYDVGNQDGVEYLVMEYLEGETLLDRLAKGPLPLDEVLRYGTEIADALDRAHRQGIVHRDLKPGNVMLTKSGVKLLDFGLARVLEPDVPIESLTSAPTAAKDLTAEGAILGTLSYMAPEQLEGKKADSRTDIFALGATLYEMATGRKAFSGSSQASLITAIMSADPPTMTAAQPMTPRALARLVQKCLAKSPEQRWQSASDLADELTWVRETRLEADAHAAIAAVRRGPLRGIRLAWAVGLIGVLALVTALALVARGRPHRAPRQVGAVRFFVSPPEGWDLALPSSLNVGGNSPITISPNGEHVAFAATAGDGRTLLWVRSLDSLAARALTGTDDASSPFWSPDSRSLGFFAVGKLKKIDASGGPPVTLCDAADNRGGAWGRDGTILFAPSGSVAARLATGLQRVSASGGPLEAATVLAAGEASHVGPTFLPDGRHFLYRALLLGQAVTGPIYLASLDSRERRLLLTASSTNVVFSEGHLLFLRETTLTAQPFDAQRMALIGEALPVAEDIGALGVPPVGIFSASENGVLLYEKFIRYGSSEIAWFDRAGKKVALGDRADYGDVNVSPDGKRAAVTVLDSVLTTRDLWIVDLARGIRSRFTFDPAEENSPIWSPDGSQIVYAFRVSGTMELYQKTTDGTGAAEVLLVDHRNKFPNCWSPDGRFILYMVDNGAPTGWDLWLLPLFGDRKPFPFLQTPFYEAQGRFSPDGRWIAYISNESGRYEAYVTHFPGPGGKWQVSSGGATSFGVWPRWRRDGKEITYLAPDDTLMAAAVNGQGDRFETGEVRPLFAPRLRRGRRSPYDVSPDGRFLINTVVERGASSSLEVILNWTAALKR
jgi:Tol biopolymer transport system component